MEGSALPQGSKAAGNALFTPLVPPQRPVLAALEKGPRLMPKSATLLLTKTLTKADSREQRGSQQRNGAGPRGERLRR